MGPFLRHSVVAEIYNKSLRTGDIPDEWRLANVTDVFKREKVGNPPNGRPKLPGRV